MCMFPATCFRPRIYMAQGLVNGVLNDTRTHLCLQFEWFSVGYRFLSYLPTPLLGQDMTQGQFLSGV